MEYYREITIDHTKVADTLTDFPVYLDLTLNSHVANANGYDVYFLDTSDNALYFELVSYDSESYRWKGFVKIPSLSSDEDTVIKVRYGDSSITTDQSSTDTWNSNYVAVYHVENDNPTDSTSNNYDLTSAGSPSVVSGQIADSLDINSTSKYLSASGIPIASNSDFTYEMWFKPSAWTGANPGLWRSGATSIGNQFNIFQGNTGRPWIRWNTGADILKPASGYGLSLGSWYFIAYTVVSASSAAFYSQGTVQHSASHSTATPSFSIYTIGYQYSTPEQAAGIYDEIRILSVSLSAEWISTEYNNQSDPLSFYSLGTEQSISPFEFSYLQTDSSTTDTDSFTFSSQPIGDANDDRYVIVAIASRKAGAAATISSVTVGGISASEVIQHTTTVTNTDVAGIFIAKVPTGTTADVVVNFSTAMLRCGIALYRIVGISGTSYDTDYSVDSTPSVSLDTPIGAAVAVFTNGNGSSVAWSGLDEDYDYSLETFSLISGASQEITSGEIGRSISATITGVNNEPVAVFASFEAISIDNLILVKIGGAFETKPLLVKISGSFAEKKISVL